MRPSSSAVLLALLLLAMAPVARAQLPTCQTTVRRVELAPGQAAAAELCISPGLSTTLFFEQPFAQDSVELEGRERFQRVESTGSVLILIPSAKLAPGERLRLKVRFTEPDALPGASFVLVVRPGQAERQVEVSRAAGTCEARLQRQEEELRRCLDQRSRPPTSPQLSLAGLLMEGILSPQLLPSRNLKLESDSQPPEESLKVMRAVLYRSLSRFVVVISVRNTHPSRPWVAASASLLGRAGERVEPFWVLQEAPLGPGEFGQVWVEAPAPETGPMGPYHLEVWDAERALSFTVKALRVP